MKNLFKYNDQPLNVIIKNEEPMFNASDLSDLLHYQKTEDALELLDEDEKMVIKSSLSDQQEDTWFVPKWGFFHLVLKSPNPEAKQIRKWVTNVVIPSITRELYANDPFSKKDYSFNQDSNRYG